MKKILCFLILIFFISLCSCTDTIKGNDCFLPSEGTSLHKDRFIKTFDEMNSSYGESIEYEVLGNYVPSKKSNRYHFDAFIVKIDESYYFFVWYNDKIYSVSDIPANADNKCSFVHFAVTDINNDGYIEIMTSLNFNKDPNPISFSFVSIIDGKSEKMVHLGTIYKAFAYFKENNDGVLGVYKSDVETIANGTYDSSNTLACNLVKNDYEFSFKEDAYEVTSENYKASISFIEDDFYFPVLANTFAVGFSVNVVMTYLGETFSYTNGTGYLAGAACAFVNGENQIKCEGWGENTVITKFVITTNMVIDRTYKYSQSLDTLFNEGKYDMIISYRGEVVAVEDFLTIIKNR